jgi:hypothetical protein
MGEGGSIGRWRVGIGMRSMVVWKMISFELLGRTDQCDLLGSDACFCRSLAEQTSFLSMA